MSGYDWDYYLSRWENDPATMAYREGRLSLDKLSALSYALGFYDYNAICAAQSASIILEQTRAIAAYQTRTPRRVLDVGCGRGELCAAFSLLQIPTVGVDSSHAAIWLASKSVLDWGDWQYVTLLEEPLLRLYNTDTVCLCEVLEHISLGEFRALWPTLVMHLRARGGHLIVTNDIDLHPISPDETGWNHISPVNDERYNEMAANASRVIFRRGSHLVLEF